MEKPFDHALLAARLMRPKRSDPWPVRKLLRGVTDPAAAWAALAPKLPAALTSAPSRKFQPPFLLPKQDEPPASPSPGRDVSSAPTTIAACLAVATDPDGIVAAEAHARETMSRLAPFGVTPRANLLWTFVPEWPGANQGGAFLLDAVFMSLQRAADEGTRPDFSMRAAFSDGAGKVQAELAHHALGPLELRLCEPFLEVCGRASQWKRACELELAVPRYEYAPGRFIAAEGKPFAQLPDPFEPLLALMLLGYWMSGATDDALVLVGTELVSQR